VLSLEPSSTTSNSKSVVSSATTSSNSSMRDGSVVCALWTVSTRLREGANVVPFRTGGGPAFHRWGDTLAAVGGFTGAIAHVMIGTVGSRSTRVRKNQHLCRQFHRNGSFAFGGSERRRRPNQYDFDGHSEHGIAMTNLRPYPGDVSLTFLGVLAQSGLAGRVVCLGHHIRQ
jgi:hypothetical protein